MSKKLQEKQRRRLAEQARKAQQQKAQRRSNLITLGIALLVGAVVVFLILQQTGGSDTAAPAGTDASEAGCTDIETSQAEGRQHVEDGTDVDYGTNPPTSGDHYGVQADPGFYPSALPEEQVVHNLEHGQIIIWYAPDAPDAVKDDLEAYVDAANDAVSVQEIPPLVAVPYDGLEGDATYGLSAWTANQSCVDYSKDVIDSFRQRFQGKGPEVVGVPVFDG